MRSRGGRGTGCCGPMSGRPAGPSLCSQGGSATQPVSTVAELYAADRALELSVRRAVHLALGMMSTLDESVLAFIGPEGQTPSAIADHFPGFDVMRLVRAQLV